MALTGKPYTPTKSMFICLYIETSPNPKKKKKWSRMKIYQLSENVLTSCTDVNVTTLFWILTISPNHNQYTQQPIRPASSRPRPTFVQFAFDQFTLTSWPHDSHSHIAIQNDQQNLATYPTNAHKKHTHTQRNSGIHNHALNWHPACHLNNHSLTF